MLRADYVIIIHYKTLLLNSIFSGKFFDMFCLIIFPFNFCLFGRIIRKKVIYFDAM